MRSPVQPREGFTGFPNDVLARAIAQLTPEQFRLFAGLVYAAEFKREGCISPCGRWRVGWAQVLVSYEGTAETYGMSPDAVRRALRRFGGVALATSGRASPATPGATSAATPPTVVDFGSWFGKPERAAEPATSPATPGATSPATSPAPIQHRNTGTQDTEAAAARERAPDDAPRRRLEVVDESGPASTPFPWAKAASFRQALTDRMARTVLYPVGGQEAKVWAALEASLGVIPEPDAVEICRERILGAHAAGKRGGGTLAYFAQVLADEALRRRRAPTPEPPAPLPDLDREWLKSLGDRRGEAEAEWVALEARVKRSAYPDALPKLLGEARDLLVARYSVPPAAAGGA